MCQIISFYFWSMYLSLLRINCTWLRIKFYTTKKSIRIDYAASVCVINNLSYKNLTFIKSTKQLVFLFVFYLNRKTALKNIKSTKYNKYHLQYRINTRKLSCVTLCYCPMFVCLYVILNMDLMFFLQCEFQSRGLKRKIILYTM